MNRLLSKIELNKPQNVHDLYFNILGFIFQQNIVIFYYKRVTSVAYKLQILNYSFLFYVFVL